MITCQIERPDYAELLGYMRFQIADAFPLLRGEERIISFTDKLYAHADFCFCRDDGHIVGMIAYYANGKGADFAYLAQVYVSPDYRRSGLYTRMLDLVVENTKEKGFHEIRLEVVRQNKIAQLCNVRNGFVMMEDEKSDASSYFMRKLI